MSEVGSSVRAALSSRNTVLLEESILEELSAAEAPAAGQGSAHKDSEVLITSPENTAERRSAT